MIVHSYWFSHVHLHLLEFPARSRLITRGYQEKMWLSHFSVVPRAPDPSRPLLQEQHVQIVRKGSEKLRINAWVVVVSYDLVAAHDAGETGWGRLWSGTRGKVS